MSGPSRGKAPVKRKRQHDLLGGILGNVGRLHSSIKPVGRQASDEQEAAAHMLMMPRQLSGGAPAGGGPERCRNPECGRSSFEVDSRRGDRVCSYCGVVQNARSLESQEEEHRTFADDENSASKKRAEVSHDGRTGGRVGDKALGRVAKEVADAAAKLSGGSMPERELNRLESFKTEVTRLAESMGRDGSLGSTQHQVLQTAKGFCEQLVATQVDHERQCPARENPDIECPDKLLSARRRAPLAAAACMVLALRKNNLDRQFSVMAQELERIDVRDVSTGEVGNAFKWADHVLKTKVCALCAPQGEAAGPSAAAEAAEDRAEEGGEDPAVVKRASLLPYICSQMQLPYLVQQRARDIIRSWVDEGMAAITNQNAAACAIKLAYDDCKHMLDKASRHGGDFGGMTGQLDIARLAEVVSLNEETIRKQVEKMPPRPPMGAA